MPSILLFDAQAMRATDKDGNPTTLGNEQSGAGDHLGGLQIDPGTKPLRVEIDDRGGRADYLEDSQSGQTLADDVTIGGVAYEAGTPIEGEYLIELTDGDGNTYKAWAVEFEDDDGPNFENVVGLIFASDNVPPFGVDLKVTDNTDLYRLSADNTEEYQYESVPCYTPGITVETTRGSVPVEALRVGDAVFTADNGPQPILWVGMRTLDAAALARRPEFRPVRLSKGAFGNDAPLLVSPQHRVGIGRFGSTLLDAPDQFARAIQLARCGGVRARIAHGIQRVTYVHFLLPSHQMVRAGGIWTESLYPGPRVLAAMPRDERKELLSLFSDLANASVDSSGPRAVMRAYGGLARPDVDRAELRQIVRMTDRPGPRVARANRPLVHCHPTQNEEVVRPLGQ